MYLVDLSRTISKAEAREDILDETRGMWKGLYEQMESSDTLWVIAPNDYRDGKLWPVAMEIADSAREESSLTLKNTITVHRWNDRGGDMESAYDEILLFVRNKREYQFHKDEIRVAHVYEGNEWGGKREEGNSAYHDTKVRRYNPDGKDPGNVWMSENRTQTDNQEVDRTSPISMEEAIERCVLAGSKGGETVHALWANAYEEIITEAGRDFSRLEITDLCTEVTQ